jgi:hypothetical protein
MVSRHSLELSGTDFVGHASAHTVEVAQTLDHEVGEVGSKSEGQESSMELFEVFAFLSLVHDAQDDD